MTAAGETIATASDVAAAPNPPQPAIAYREPTRIWPWDVRVIVWMSVTWAAIQVMQGAIGAFQILRDNNLNWFGGNFHGWVYVFGVLLRSLLPTLLIIGLIGLLKFKPGARRVAVLCAGAFVAFGVFETLAHYASMMAQKPYVYELPAYVLGVAQQFTTQFALMLVLCVTLTRADVKLLAKEN
jgi:hypothetical protein